VIGADTREAVVAVVRRDGHVLVIRRAPGVVFPGYWTPVSGRVRRGETQEMAVTREVFEEVGLRAVPLAKVWSCDTEDGQFHLHWWLADVDAGEMTIDPAEVNEARWIRPADFAALAPTFADDRLFFAEILPALPSAEADAERRCPSVAASAVPGLGPQLP
jgi:8-oxo-dGTP diphosphatase